MCNKYYYKNKLVLEIIKAVLPNIAKASQMTPCCHLAGEDVICLLCWNLGWR